MRLALPEVISPASEGTESRLPELLARPHERGCLGLLITLLTLVAAWIDMLSYLRGCPDLGFPADTHGADDRRDHCNLLLACSISPDHEKLSHPLFGGQHVSRSGRVGCSPALPSRSFSGKKLGEREAAMAPRWDQVVLPVGRIQDRINACVVRARVVVNLGMV